MSGTVCKQQSSKCKCIVKEKIIDCKDDKNDKNDKNPDNKDCSEVYKQLGSCLQECLMEKSRTKRIRDDKLKSNGDSC